MLMGFFFVFSVASNLCHCILIVFVRIVIVLENSRHPMNHLDTELNLVVTFSVTHVRPRLIHIACSAFKFPLGSLRYSSLH